MCPPRGHIPPTRQGTAAAATCRSHAYARPRASRRQKRPAARVISPRAPSRHASASRPSTPCCPSPCPCPTAFYCVALGKGAGFSPAEDDDDDGEEEEALLSGLLSFLLDAVVATAFGSFVLCRFGSVTSSFSSLSSFSVSVPLPEPSPPPPLACCCCQGRRRRTTCCPCASQSRRAS